MYSQRVVRSPIFNGRFHPHIVMRSLLHIWVASLNGRKKSKGQ